MQNTQEIKGDIYLLNEDGKAIKRVAHGAMFEKLAEVYGAKHFLDQNGNICKAWEVAKPGRYTLIPDGPSKVRAFFSSIFG